MSGTFTFGTLMKGIFWCEYQSVDSMSHRGAPSLEVSTTVDTLFILPAVVCCCHSTSMGTIHHLQAITNTETVDTHVHGFTSKNQECPATLFLLFNSEDWHQRRMNKQLHLHTLPLNARSPEDTLCLVSIETQNLLRKAGLHPGQLPVWIPFLLKCHYLFQRWAKHRGTENCIPGMFNLFQTRFLQALQRGIQNLRLRWREVGVLNRCMSVMGRDEYSDISVRHVCR